MLRKQYGIDQARLETLARSRELAKGEYERVKRLFTKDKVGTQSGVDRSEMAFNQANDGFDQLKQLVTLYPMRVEEADSGLKSAEAQLALASTSLERTEVRAPFAARLKKVQVELGQYVSPGLPVLILANDSVLEVSVALDSREVRGWMRFNAAEDGEEAAWFAPEPVRCRVQWTEAPETHYTEGVLDRVERFDEFSRTVTVAIRINAADRKNGNVGLPLVDGMYCRVEIPGKTVNGVYRLPRWAVSFEGQVYLAREGVDFIFLPGEPGSDERKDAEARLAEIPSEAEEDAEGDKEEYDLWKRALTVAESLGEGEGRPSHWAIDADIPPVLITEMESLWETGEPAIIAAPEGIYVARGAARLKRRDVVVQWEENEEAFVSSGLALGDRAVITRLVNPLPNSLLKYTRATETSVADGAS